MMNTTPQQQASSPKPAEATCGALFWSFFKVGTFTIGGGYAMVPLMQRELVDRHGWISADDFAQQIALCQAMPGVFATNMAALTGQRLRGAGGAAAAIAGTVLMPIIFILLLATLLGALRGNVYVERIFMALRPASAALIAAAAVGLLTKVQRRWLWLPLAVGLAICLLGVSPIWVVVAAAAIGAACSRWF